MTGTDLTQLARRIKDWGAELGFSRTAVCDVDLAACEEPFAAWLAAGFAGEMDYLSRHGTRRTRPAELVPGTVRAITVSMDYLAAPMDDARRVLAQPGKAYISRYALGRDYHRVLRRRLQRLADRITDAAGPFGYRAFCDSAPVLEKALARKAGQGWVGKHTNILDRNRGSWFFLGELYTDLPLPTDAPAGAHCGSCTACIDVCPTRAIVAPYVLDARRCISYHTIELHGPIPVEFRAAMGNRVFGCDDCQLVCPWNRYARVTAEPDFQARHGLDDPDLVALFDWDEETFRRRTEGSALRRVGWLRWLRNLAVALGNAPASPAAVAALERRRAHPSALVREHVAWALDRQRARAVARDGG